VSEKEITHEGVVVLTGSDAVTVMIDRQISCAGCKAINICSAGRSNDKTIKIDGNFDIPEGSKVLVSISTSQSFLALFLGYILPLVVLVLTLFVLIGLSVGEALAGLISLGATALYYFILYLSGSKVSKKFSFRIKKL